jgi:hypothetical protein
MRATILMVGAAALAFAPSFSSAQTAPGNGQYNGTHYWHSNSGNANGQPGASCEDLGGPEAGVTPGHSSSAPGSAFNPDGNAGSKYAGEQPQNSRNSANSSQYDAACSHQQPL